MTKKLNRREFLKIALLGTVAVVIGKEAAPAPAPTPEVTEVVTDKRAWTREEVYKAYDAPDLYQGRLYVDTYVTEELLADSVIDLQKVLCDMVLSQKEYYDVPADYVLVGERVSQHLSFMDNTTAFRYIFDREDKARERAKEESLGRWMAKVNQSVNS